MDAAKFGAVVLALLTAQLAGAATCTWTGGGTNSSWSTIANWDNCGGAHPFPVDGDTLVFPNGVPRPANSNDLVKLLAGQLQLNGLNYNITGNPIGLSGGISANVPAGSIFDFSPVLNLNVTLETNAQTIQCIGSKGLRLYGIVNLNGQALTVDGACATNLAGNIVGAGSLTKYGTGTLSLSGPASTYTGQTTIHNGILSVQSDAALGASGPGNETLAGTSGAGGLGSSLQLNGNTTGETLEFAPVGFNGACPLISNGNGLHSVVTGNVYTSGVVCLAATPATNTLTLSGEFVGNGYYLPTVGAGTLQLEGDSYGTGWEAEAGILEINGTAADVRVDPGALLAGSGDITSITEIKSGGVIAPGPSRGTGPGTISEVTLKWDAGAIMAFNLGATSDTSDHIALSASLERVNSGSFTFDFADASTPPKPGVTYTLISFASQVGFIATDFDFVYTGTGPGSSMTGTFSLTSTELQFTSATVVSDLIFRASNE